MKRILFIALSLLSLTTYAQRPITIGTPGSGTATTPTTSLTYTATGTPFDAVGARGLDQRITTNTTNTTSLSASVTQLQSQTASAGSGSPYIRSTITARALGVPYKYFTDAANLADATNAVSLPNNNNQILQSIYIPVSETITGIGILVTNVGAYTATTTGASFALYSINGAGTFTKVAETAVSTTLFKTAGWVQVPFTTTPSVAAGAYYVGVVHNYDSQTTAPQIYSAANRATGGDLSNRPTGSITFLNATKFGTTWPATFTHSADIAGGSIFRYLLALY